MKREKRVPSMITITRRALLGGASAGVLLSAIPAIARPKFMRGGRGVPGAPPGEIVTATVANTSSSAMTAPYVQFYQGFAEGDLTDGSILEIEDDLGGAVTYTAARRADYPLADTNRLGADLFCKLSNNIAAKLAITSLTISGTTATCTTTGSHSLTTGDKVLIQPVNNDVAVGNPSAMYSGLVTVTVTGASTFTYTVIGSTPSGSADVSMEMCYTRTLTINSVAGSWNDTLPAGKTSSNILTDLQANFDNITLELVDFKTEAGATVGSGTYAADFFTCIAEAGTDQLRVTATGPTLCDFTGIMKFADTTGGARHATIAGRFYVSAILNPTTGDVVEVNARAFVDQSLMNAAQAYYTFRSRMKLGSTVVRSLGLSSNAAIDGKLQTFAAAAVTIATDRISLSGHGFQGGERVQFTTSGTLPGGLSAATNYYVIYVSDSEISVTLTSSHTNQIGTSTPLNLTSQGTGNHTITCWQQSPYATYQAYTDKTGAVDRWTGNSGALSSIGYHVVHDAMYLQLAKFIPPIDLTVNFANPVAAISATEMAAGAGKSRYVFGSPGIQAYDQDTGGFTVYKEYGAGWSNVPCRRARYPHEKGFTQTLRTCAFGLGAWDMMYTADDTTWRAPVMNNGPDRAGGTFTGMPAPTPTNRWFRDQVVGFTPATSYTHNPGNVSAAGLSWWSSTHRYSLLAQMYLFDGRQEIHDLMLNDAMQQMLWMSEGTYTGSGSQITRRRFALGGTTYDAFIAQSDPRGDAFAWAQLTQAVRLASSDAPERPVIKMYIDDTIAVMNYIIYTEGATLDPDWLDYGGGWLLASAMKNGPGAVHASNDQFNSILYEGFFGICLSYALSIYPDPTFSTVCGHFAKFYDNFYRVIHDLGGSSWISNATALRSKRAYGAISSPDGTKYVSDITLPIIMDQNIDGCIFLPDGRVWGIFGNLFSPVMYPETGDRHTVATISTGNGTHWAPFAPPPELDNYTEYYVRQAPGGSYYGFKYATTDSDGTIIPTYSVLSTTTSSTNIGTGTTAITTASAVSNIPNMAGASGASNNLIVIDSGAGMEIVNVTAGEGTTSLTIVRARYGTTALAHGTGATVYVPYAAAFYTDLHMRPVAFPPTGHGWRVPGAANTDKGYRTMSRQACAGWYITGKIAIDAFNNASEWFDDATDSAGNGPTSFSVNNSLQNSVGEYLFP